MPWEKMLWLGILMPTLVIGSAFAQTTTKASDKGGAVTMGAAASASAGAASGRAAPAGARGGASQAAAATSSGVGATAKSGAATPTTASSGAQAQSAVSSAKPAAGGAMDGGTYSVRLRDLEQRIDELKEQIRRSHTRLSLLTDTILSGGVVGSRSEIQFRNELSSAFRLTRALFVLDGSVQYNKSDDTGALAEQQQIPVFSGSIPPGDHTLHVTLELQGNGYGVFSYLKGYRFTVKSSRSFTAVEGKTLALQAVAFEKGGATTPLEERPNVRFEEKVSTGITPSPKAEPAAPANVKGGASLSTGVSVGAGGK